MRRKLNNPDLPMLKMECAHIFSRKNKNIRHYEGNAVTLCFTCHNKFSSDETEWRKFIVSIIGQSAFDLLLLEKNKAVPHWDRLPEKEISKHYRSIVTGIATKQGKLWIIQGA